MFRSLALTLIKYVPMFQSAFACCSEWGKSELSDRGASLKIPLLIALSNVLRCGLLACLGSAELLLSHNALFMRMNSRMFEVYLGLIFKDDLDHCEDNLDRPTVGDSGLFKYFAQMENVSSRGCHSSGSIHLKSNCSISILNVQK